MLTDSATQPRFFRSASIVLLATAAWFSGATLATAQGQNQDQPQDQNSAQQAQRTDSAIEGDVSAAFQQDSALQGQRILPTAANGVVTLTGSVQTEAQSQQAETDAANVAGVSGILNHLKIENPSSTATSVGLVAQTSANQLSPGSPDRTEPARGSESKSEFGSASAAGRSPARSSPSSRRISRSSRSSPTESSPVMERRQTSRDMARRLSRFLIIQRQRRLSPFQPGLCFACGSISRSTQPTCRMGPSSRLPTRLMSTSAAFSPFRAERP